MVCTYHFFKKKKKKVGWICGNSIAEIGGNLFIFHSYFGNAIAQIHSTFFFFLEMICAHNFYNILQQILSGRLLLLD